MKLISSKKAGLVFGLWLVLQFVASALVFADSGNQTAAPEIQVAQSASACPIVLQKLTTAHLGQWDLCQVYQSYQNSLRKLRQKGVTAPEYIAAWRGPRFINFPDWSKQAVFSGYNPWYVYKPAPKTWESWENGHAFTMEQVKKNLAGKKIAAIDLDWIKNLHKISMKDMYVSAGSFRNHAEIGLQLNREEALPENIIAVLNDGSGYRSLADPDEPLMSWHPTICWDEQKKEVLDHIAIQKANKESWFDSVEWVRYGKDLFFDSEGVKKQCGYIAYAPSREVVPELQNYLKKINELTAQWYALSATDDVLETVAKAQRVFIAIHPFKDGNGRTSRYIMDLLLESLGLPAPVLADMNNDVFVSEKVWADEIGRGIFRTLEILKRCGENPNREACQMISSSPEELIL